MNKIENYIIDIGLVEVFINGESQGFHNEYTCRNLQVAVAKGEISNVELLYKYKDEFDKTVEIRSLILGDGNISDNLGLFYSTAVDLKFELLRLKCKKI
jgi:hypothetical protein